MNDINLVRSAIFLIAGLISILFRKRLDDFKNKMFRKLDMEHKVKDERRVYVYFGIVFIIISVFLFVFAIA